MEAIGLCSVHTSKDERLGEHSISLDKAAIISALQAELQKHVWDYFVENPPSIAEGGQGVIVPGCTMCKRRAHKVNQFMDHLVLEAVPRAVDSVFKAKEDAQTSYPTHGAFGSSL